MARPTKYSAELVASICGRISRGESLKRITDDEDMPCSSTVYLWLSENTGFSEMYTRAKEDSADAMADDILYIADGEGDVQRDRLRVDSRKWIAAKLKPRKYGERVQNELTGADGGPIHISIGFRSTG